MLWFGGKDKKQQAPEGTRRGIAIGGTADQISNNINSHKTLDRSSANGASDIPADVRRMLGHDASVVMPAVRRVYQLTSAYPASVRHHDSDPGGLWRHSFDVASACLTHITKYNQDRQYQTGAFLVGLLHDVGKVALYKVETAGYDYHPLLLQPLTDGSKITGKISEGTSYRHHYLSTLLIYPLLGEELIIKLGPALLAEIVEAVALAHVAGTTSSNPMLLALRDADRITTAASLSAMVGGAAEGGEPFVSDRPGSHPTQVLSDPRGIAGSPVPRDSMRGVAGSPVPPRTILAPADPMADAYIVLPSLPRPIVTQDLLGVYLDSLRHKITREWQENFCFFVFGQADVIAIVNPRFTMDLLALVTRRLGRDVPEAIIMEALDKADLVAIKADGGRKHFVMMDIAVSGIPDVRHLSSLCLRLSRIFPRGTQPTFKGGAQALTVRGVRVEDLPAVHAAPTSPATYVLNPEA